MSLNCALQILQRQKGSFERIVGKLNQEQVRARNRPLTWTVLEIIDHLRKVETAFADEMLGSGTSSSDNHPPGRVKPLLLIVFMFLPFKVKVPSGVPVEPDLGLERATVLERWDESRKRLLRCICELQNEPTSRGVVQHPVAGWMSLNASAWFLAAHLIHHRYQLRRVLR